MISTSCPKWLQQADDGQDPSLAAESQIWPILQNLTQLKKDYGERAALV
jgi:hypothetical protein